MKKVDVAVFDTIEALTKDSFQGGGDTFYDVANGGVGYGKVSPDAPDRDALIAKLDGVSEQIASGRHRHPARASEPRAPCRAGARSVHRRSRVAQ